jgi:cytochrome c2
VLTSLKKPLQSLGEFRNPTRANGASVMFPQRTASSGSGPEEVQRDKRARKEGQSDSGMKAWVRCHLMPSPPAPAGSFDAAGAERGRLLFDRTCATCHVGASGTDNNSGTLHAPAETGVDGAYAARTANKAYRTTPLRALWQHAPYFHDGSAAKRSSPLSWRTTTGFALSALPRISNATSSSISSRDEGACPWRNQVGSSAATGPASPGSPSDKNCLY